ncbi:hypothetical protein BD414DRAFT_493951 [Trametes punicea]|nr:hypothetical protein BD414DRAFT_493951 [Trametes punicea]
MGSHSRRRSHSSSSSSSSSSDEEKKWKKKNKLGIPEPVVHGMPPPYAAATAHVPQGIIPSFPVPGGHDAGHIAVPGGHGGPDVARTTSPVPSMGHPFTPPHSNVTPATPPANFQPPPPSGFRVPLTDAVPFPAQQAGQPVAYDADGRTPVYVGSAFFGKGVHPCKIVPTFNPPVRVAYGGGEHEHRGRYDLLPFDPNTMEWVPTSHGQIPYGRRPVEGGYEENGGKLYHALADVHGVKVPGKTGTHLQGANVPFGGQEHVVEHDYAILCWRY